MRIQQAGPSNRPAAYHNISLNDAMPAEGLTQEEQPRFTHRNIEYRLLPGSKANGAKLDGLAGACRYVWNTILGQINDEYEQSKEAGKKGPSRAFSHWASGSPRYGGRRSGYRSTRLR